MGFGKLVASASAASGSLKKLIKAGLVEEREVPFLDDNSYLRVSSIPDMCPREEVLATTTRTARTRKVDADLSLIFAHGTALHHILQNKVLADIGALVGVWRCVECAKQFGEAQIPIGTSQALVRKPKKCECGCEDFHYREQHFVDEQYRIGGHPDGFLVIQGLPGLGVVECKSISSNKVWEVRQTPQLGHAVQAQCYLWLTGLKWAKILYWEKGGFGLTALVEHTIERDEETIDRVKSMIRSIWDGIAKNELPPRICTTPTCPRASSCPLVSKCFENL